MSIGTSLIIGCVVLTVMSMGFALLARFALGRHGGRGLLAAWITCTFVTTSLMVLRLVLLQRARGVTDRYATPARLFWSFLPYFALSLGAVSVFVRRRAAPGGEMTIGWRGLAESIPAFWAGGMLFIIGRLALDYMSMR